MPVPIVGRLTYALGRLFGSPQPVPPSALDDLIYSTVEVDSNRPERAFIQGERIFIGQADVTAGGVSNGAVTLTIQAGATSLIILEYIRCQALTVSGTFNFYLGSPAPAGAPVTVIARDMRIGAAPAIANAQASMQSSTAYANPASGLFMSWNQVIANQDHEEFTLPLIIAPTGGVCGLAIVSQSITARFFCTIGWRERPLAAGEQLI